MAIDSLFQKHREWFIGIASVNVATFAWATNMVLGRWLRDSIGPVSLSAARFLVASLFFILLLQRREAAERRPGRDIWLLLGMALTGVVIFAPTLYLGLRYTTATNATLINGFGPLITGLLAATLIGEPMAGRQVAGALVGLAGVVVLISGGDGPAWLGFGNLGDLIMLGAVTLWGLYSVLGRRVMRRRSALSASAMSAFLGLPFLLLASLWEMQAIPIRPSPVVLGALVYIGIASTVIGFVAWNTGIRRLGPSGAMVFYNTLPVYGALLGFLFLGETAGWPHLLGGSLIIGGGLWASGQFGKSQRQP